MKVKTLSLMAGLGGSLLLASSAQADYSIEWADVTTALDGGPMPPSFPGGLRIVEVYVQMDDPTDQVVGVVGSPTNPFSVSTLGGTGFVNQTSFLGNNNQAPVEAFVDAVAPQLNWDSFFTIGLRSTGPGSQFPAFVDELIIAPGTTNPGNHAFSTDKWPADPAQRINMAWTVPPTLDGVPTPQSVAGNFPMNRVLIMRLVVAGGAGAAGMEDIMGTMGVLIFDDGVGQEVPGSFTTVTPAPGALALLGLAGLAGATRRRRA